jgi:acyl carrier protein
MKGAQMENVINDYISREIVQDPAVLPLSNDTSLLRGGILDSLSLLRLVVFLQDRFQLTVDETDLLPENFDSVDAICAYRPPWVIASPAGAVTWISAAGTGNAPR